MTYNYLQPTSILTLKEFLELPYGEMFAVGFHTDDANGINMTGNGGSLKWVAKKGRIDDWAIYCHHGYQSTEYVLTNGDKVTMDENILRCVNCEQAVLDLYRY